MQVPVYATDMDGTINYFNEAAVEFAGMRPEPGQKWCVTKSLYTLDGQPMPPEDCPMAVTLRQQRPVRGLEAVAERPDGTRRSFKSYPTPILDDNGTMVGALNVLVDTTDEHTGDENFYLAAIVASSDDAIVSKTLEGRVTSWNAGAERIFGYTAEEMIGQPITRIIPPDLLWEEDTILARLRTGQRIEHYDTVRIAKSGRRVEVSITVSPVRGKSGRLIGASKVARDVTQRKQSERLRALLVEELNHRVKNTLATVQALANQTLRHSSDASDFAASFSGRLQSLARTHTLLTQNTWQGAELHPVLRDQVLAETDENRIALEGPAVMLDPQSALHVALAAHELATNARKYGALSVPEGRLSIRWSVEFQDGQVLKLDWREEGGPPVRAPTKRGFGSNLIEQSLKTRGGTSVLSYQAEGLVCTITLPLVDIEPEQFSALDRELTQGWSKPHIGGSKGPSLAGKRLILVEDEPLVAMDLACCLKDLGCELVGTAMSLETGHRLLTTASYDAALLDANLSGHPVDELAAVLAQRGTPFAFVTGYGREGLPAAFKDAPLINKPVSIDKLRSTIQQLVQGSGAEVIAFDRR
jgi:PAS domain S-box-containing protein